MFEYLVVWEENGTEHREIVGFGVLLDHIKRALDDDTYCFWAYEVHQIAVDFSIPRESCEEECPF